MNIYKIIYKDLIYFTNADNIEEAERGFMNYNNNVEIDSKIDIIKVDFVDEDGIVF